MMTSLRTDTYKIDLVHDVAVSSDPVYRWGDDPAVSVMVTPHNGQRWMGHFEAGGLRTGCTGVVSTPSSLHCCTVIDGRAYVVDVLRPESTRQIPGDDIVEISNHDGVTLLLSHIDIVGIGADGSCWRSERLASDQIRGISVTWPFIAGEGWMASRDSWQKFQLDARTGMSRGCPETA